MGHGEKSPMPYALNPWAAIPRKTHNDRLSADARTSLTLRYRLGMEFPADFQ